jgi:hypothetical protein
MNRIQSFGLMVISTTLFCMLLGLYHKVIPSPQWFEFTLIIAFVIGYTLVMIGSGDDDSKKN